MLKQIYGSVLVIVLGLSCSLPVRAQNLLVNGDFAADLASWDVLFGRVAAWDSRDSANDAGSGSALLTHVGMGNGAIQLILGQCLPVTTGQGYQFGADVLVPPGQGDAGISAQVFVTGYETTTCQGTSTNVANAGGFDLGSETWQTIDSEFIATTTTQSIRVALGVQKSSGVSADTMAFFDDVFFGDFGFVFSFATIDGIWTNPAETAGQGLLFDYSASLNQVFVAWFTDLLDTLEPSEPAQGRRLLTALMTIDGNTLRGVLRVNEDDGMGDVAVRDIGMIEIDMTACDAGSVQLDVTTPATTVNFDILPLEKQVNPAGFSCAIL